ncbi:coil containing protein [Vibrio phage 3.058.O._10N.286.46.B8]|uniref:hypothetical protein n=1 Tax=Vibrio phage henriette 12B8 TaxID=573174 RepID=UPI0002C11650|nr:hypothetical protein VPDG_00003 [Vibrio phage henriette 12B8]AGG58165.1 hypothetical protein VPDG_00003 [Vibrio phage henriette 12B8]AUS02044.1 coil containing protein [Vibrio phage 2.058.O._10N.286.46.B8]AUS03196.1 coil containing protein [Vibrio phage 3.058.O._10N.286.46.B8]
MKKFLAALFGILFKTGDRVDVSTELSELKRIQSRLALAKEQKEQDIATSECNKLDLETDLEEDIRKLKVAYEAEVRDEEEAIKAADTEISEIDDWLGMFPKPKSK